MSPSPLVCPACGQSASPAHDFCVECGAPLAGAPALPSLSPAVQTQFTLPDYLLAAREREATARRRRLAAEGAGGGLVWSGIPMVAGALIFSSGGGIGDAVLGLGLTLILAGFFRMRRDPQAMARAGVATVAVGSVALGAVLLQLLDLGGPLPDPPSTQVARPTPTVDPSEVAAVASPVGPRDGVPMFRGDPAHTGQNPGPGPSGRPRSRWRAHTGGELYASPVVAGETVFVGTKSGFLAAIETTTGRERWRFDLGGYIARSTPAVAEADGVVFVAAGYALFAIDATTGAERWQVPTRFVGSSSPTVAGGLVYLGTQEGHLYALDAVTGRERWHDEVEGLIFGSPAVANGLVFVGGDNGTVHAHDATTGRERWTFAAGGGIYASPAAADGVLYVVTTTPELIALDAATGGPRWRKGVGGEASPAVAATGERVFVGSDDNGLYALDAANGAVHWLFATGAPIVSSPVVVGETVFVGGGSTLYAVNGDGQARWSYPTGGTIQTSPAVVGDTVYVGSHDGYLYAIGGDAPPAGPGG